MNKAPDFNKVFSDYHKAVNMSYGELKRWSKNPWSKLASLSRGPIERNLRLLSKKKSEWDVDDVLDAKRTIAFNARMKGVVSGKNVKKEVPLSKRDISLRNWAWNPRKDVGL